MNFDIMLLCLLAFGVIGLVEWWKSLVAAIKAKSGIDAVIGSLIASMVAGFAAAYGDLWKGITTGLVLLAFVELGYSLVIQTVTGLIRRLIAPPDQPPKQGE